MDNNNKLTGHLKFCKLERKKKNQCGVNEKWIPHKELWMSVKPYINPMHYKQV